MCFVSTQICGQGGRRGIGDRNLTVPRVERAQHTDNRGECVVNVLATTLHHTPHSARWVRWAGPQTGLQIIVNSYYYWWPDLYNIL